MEHLTKEPLYYDVLKPYLNGMLLGLLGNRDLVLKWWDTPNKAFDMSTPQQVYDVDHERVKLYISKFCYGDYF